MRRTGEGLPDAILDPGTIVGTWTQYWDTPGDGAAACERAARQLRKSGYGERAEGRAETGLEPRGESPGATATGVDWPPGADGYRSRYAAFLASGITFCTFSTKASFWNGLAM